MLIVIDVIYIYIHGSNNTSLSKHNNGYCMVLYIMVNILGISVNDDYTSYILMKHDRYW